MRRITLDLPEELLERVDRARGIVPRAAYIRQALEQKVRGELEPVIVGPNPTSEPLPWEGPPLKPASQLPCKHEWFYDETLGEDRCGKCGEVKE